MWRKREKDGVRNGAEEETAQVKKHRYGTRQWSKKDRMGTKNRKVGKILGKKKNRKTWTVQTQKKM